MALDPRIALMGTQWQAPDIQGALAKGQEYRTNQMAQQAAQATAELNRNAMNDAALLDPNDRAAQQQYALRYGAAATPFLTALSGVDTNFAGRGTERRAEGEFNTKQRVSLRDFLQREVGSFLNDPSDANIAASRARAVAQGIDAADFDAYAAPYTALPVGERAPRMRNDLGTTAEGRALVEMFADKYSYVDTGGAQTPVQTNMLASGATPPPVLRVTADPAKYTDFPTADGNITRVYADGRREILRDETGAPLTAAPTPAQQQAAAEVAAEQTSQANARQDVNGTLESMMAEYDNLYRLGAIVSTDRTGAQNVGAAAGASLPGRVVGRALGSEAQTARDNIAAAMPQIMLGLQTASGLSSTQLNSNAELQFFKRILGDPDASYQTVVDAIGRFQRFADSLLGGGGGAAPPARRAPPQAGEVRAGYRFRGGDPGNQSNWTPVR